MTQCYIRILKVYSGYVSHFLHRTLVVIWLRWSLRTREVPGSTPDVSIPLLRGNPDFQPAGDQCNLKFHPVGDQWSSGKQLP